MDGGQSLSSFEDVQDLLLRRNTERSIPSLKSSSRNAFFVTCSKLPPPRSGKAILVGRNKRVSKNLVFSEDCLQVVGRLVSRALCLGRLVSRRLVSRVSAATVVRTGTSDRARDRRAPRSLRGAARAEVDGGRSPSRKRS